MLKVITKIELVSQYANAANKFCIYISTTEKDSVDEIQMAVPFLSAGNCFLLLNDFVNKISINDTFLIHNFSTSLPQIQ